MAGEWVDRPLGQVVTLKRGYDLPTQDRQPGPYPVVSSSGITGRHSVAKVTAPGVVTGRYGTLGVIHYILEDFWPLNTTLYVQDFKGNDPRFISYFLQCLDFQAFNDKSSVPGLNRNHLHAEIVRVPLDIDEQRFIAEILGSLDDKIELNRRMNVTLEAMARAIFKAWFVDFEPVKAKAAGATSFPGMPKDAFDQLPDQLTDSELGPIPEGWNVGSILDRADLISGGTPKTDRPDFWNGDIPWASARDVSQCRQTFLIQTEKRITEKGLEGSSTKLIPAWSTAIVARGATTGRMAMFGHDTAMNQTCYALRSKSGADVALYFLLRNRVGDLVNSAHGSVFDTITTHTFKSSLILLPTESLLEAYDRGFRPLFQNILVAQKQSSTLAAIRDALLPKLISGEITVPHNGDEADG